MQPRLPARATYPPTVRLPIPVGAAISARVRPQCFSLNTSRTVLIDSRSVIASVYAMRLRPRRSSGAVTPFGTLRHVPRNGEHFIGDGHERDRAAGVRR